MVELVLRQKAYVNHHDSRNETALMLAAQQGDSDVVRLLLKHGAKTNDEDVDELTAWVLAAKKGEVEVCELLHHKVPVQDDARGVSFSEGPTSWQIKTFKSLALARCMNTI